MLISVCANIWGRLISHRRCCPHISETISQTWFQFTIYFRLVIWMLLYHLNVPFKHVKIGRLWTCATISGTISYIFVVKVLNRSDGSMKMFMKYNLNNNDRLRCKVLNDPKSHFFSLQHFLFLYYNVPYAILIQKKHLKVEMYIIFSLCMYSLKFFFF